MTLHLKEPASTLDYSVDWGPRYLDESDELASSTWTVSPEQPGGLTVEEMFVEGAIATARVSGGLAGRLYRLRNEVTTGRGLRDRRTLVIRVEER